MPFSFLDFEALYLKAYWYSEVLIGHVQNHRHPKIFCPEVIRENKLKKSKKF